MQDLVDAIGTATGLEPVTARKAVGIVLDFIQKSVPPATSAAVIDHLPGGRLAAAGAAEDEAEGGGSGTSGLLGLADRLMAEGVGSGDLQPLARVVFDHLRHAVGPGPVDAVRAAIPGLDAVL